jgi:sRNA-binding regulator protein Hfq
MATDRGRNYDEVRREQQREGRQMAAEERQPMRRHSDRFPSKKKAEPKGHEAFLKALEESGKEQGTKVEVEKMNGVKRVGIVKCSDHYTITLRVPAPEESCGFIDWVMFKHDISEFRALQGKKREEKPGE